MGFDWYGNVFAFDPGKTCLLEIWDLSEREVDLNEGEVRWNDMSWGRQRRIIRLRHERGLKTLERKNSCHYHPMYYSHLHPVNSVLFSTFSTLNGFLIII